MHDTGFFEEQYLIYIALTRSSEKLYLSYPLADDEGGAIACHVTCGGQAQSTIPRSGETFLAHTEPDGERVEDLAFVNNPLCTLPHLVTRMREVKAGQTAAPFWAEVYSWFMGSSCREKTSFALSSLFTANKEARLPAPVSKALYGPRLKTSISGIEKFLACPFAHFLARGLRLQERIIYKVGAPELGQFFHAALKNIGDQLRKMGIGWGQLDHEQCRLLAGDIVDKLVRLQNEILISTARRRYLVGKLKRIVRQTALALVEHYRRGSFQPVGLELAFGPDGDLPAITCALPGGREMILTGRIDRVDAVQGEEGCYLRIIDYKTGGSKVNLQDIYHGLKLQLPAYLNVALCYAGELLGADQALPGAMLYFPIADPLVKTNGDHTPSCRSREDDFAGIQDDWFCVSGHPGGAIDGQRPDRSVPTNTRANKKRWRFFGPFCCFYPGSVWFAWGTSGYTAD
ncbi:MAG: PD-(D/E)XK nuclease family protein [Candidatus Syntrophopropionicum ammoniitolerans]